MKVLYKGLDVLYNNHLDDEINAEALYEKNSEILYRYIYKAIKRYLILSSYKKIN